MTDTDVACGDLSSACCTRVQHLYVQQSETGYIALFG